jgi:hypothetical protein
LSIFYNCAAEISVAKGAVEIVGEIAVGADKGAEEGERSESTGVMG